MGRTSEWSIFRGLTMALSSGAINSVVAVVVKHMTNMHTGQLAVYRFLGIFAFSLPQAVQCRKDLCGPKATRLMLVLQGLVGGLSMFLNFIAFRNLPLGEGAVIKYSSPVFVTLLARLVLKEEFSVVQGLSVVMTVVGIIFVARIPLVVLGSTAVFTTQGVYGIVAALSSMLLSSSRYIIMRKLKDVHVSVVMFNYGWLTVLVSVVLTYLLGDFRLHLCGVQPWLIIGLVLASFSAHLLLTMAQQCEQAGPVATLRSASDIAMSLVFQIFVFHDSMDEFSITGIVLVSLSVVLVGLRKWILSLPQDYKMQRYFGWLKF